jgi:hypothetical protein
MDGVSKIFMIDATRKVQQYVSSEFKMEIALGVTQLLNGHLLMRVNI